MTLPQSHRPIARSISQRSVPVIAAAALLVFIVSGCGINITPPQADSSTVDSAEDPSATMPMASTPTGGAGMGMSDPGMAGMPGAADTTVNPSTEMDETMHGSAAGDPTTDPAVASTIGSPGVNPADTTGMTPEQMREMMEQQHAADGAPGAAAAAGAGLTPEQTREMMEQQAANAGAAPPGAAAGAAANPGQPGAEGAEGAGGSNSRASQFDEGTPAHTVMLMVEAIDAGDMETAAKYIGDDADGLLGSVRDGEAGQNQLSQLQSYFATMDPIRARPSGRSITLTFNGGLNKVLSFVVAREGRDFVVESLTIRDAPSRGGR